MIRRRCKHESSSSESEMLSDREREKEKAINKAKLNSLMLSSSYHPSFCIYSFFYLFAVSHLFTTTHLSLHFLQQQHAVYLRSVGEFIHSVSVFSFSFDVAFQFKIPYNMSFSFDLGFQFLSFLSLLILPLSVCVLFLCGDDNSQ
ncbi:hypothetical protein HanXRQr2_Chr14g0648971 [Helianthus annuus]|uniref:Transmembrane protein n=1 Tax=Helianthus annuus TaxID=4232 RepID=A0A9K3H732_HELAN|nr:hypothetical protein HanXRQr2_Chr14g0648971 [Helianthus annuus]